MLSDDLDLDTSLSRGRYCDIEVDQYGDPHRRLITISKKKSDLKKNGTSWDG